MNTENEINQFITEYCRKYPSLTISDILKVLHQSSFGCGHLLASHAYDYLIEEMSSTTSKDDCIIPLPGAFSIVPLSYIKKLNITPDTFYKIFYLSTKENIETREQLEAKLNILLQMTEEGIIAFDKEELTASISQWHKNNFHMLRHSQSFRENYSPAYRVIHKRFLPFLKLFAYIDMAHLNAAPVLVAIEGGSASGKSTLASLLAEIYDCNVFHIDDFFLRPEQKTKERLTEPGGNFDRERFITDVMIPLSEGKSVCYEPYDCCTQQILKGITYQAKKINIIEGAYSMHPDMAHHYTLSVFLDIDKSLQKERIHKRNSPIMQEKFFSTWIPMEEIYFDTFHIKDSCKLVIPIR